MSNNQSNPNHSANIPIPNESDDQPTNTNEPDAGHQTIDRLANIAFPSSSVSSDDQSWTDDVASGDDNIANPLSSMSVDDLPRVNNQTGTNEDVIMTDDEPANPSSSSPEQLNYDNGQCAICLGPQVDRSRPRCGHVFCFDCLKEWCRVKLECPTCRQPFTNFVHMITGTATNETSEVYTPDPPLVPAQNRHIVTIRFPIEWLPLLNETQFQRFLFSMFIHLQEGGQAENAAEPPPNSSTDDQPNANNPSNNSN